MSKSTNFEFREASVQFPKREKAYVFFSHDGIPFKSATLGITYPYEAYYMKRSTLFEVCVFEYVLEGEVEILIDGVWKKASAGDFYILSSKYDQCYRTSPEKLCKKMWINYVSDYMPEFLRAYGTEMGIYRSSTAKVYFDELFEIIKQPDIESDAPLRIADLLHKIVKVAAVKKKKETTDDYEMIKHISEYVYKKLNLDELAEKMHMSKSNLIRRFKKQCGVTPYEYLLALKIEAAKILLRDTGMSIKEISSRLHINDDHYFSSLFLRKVGVRPGVYRKGKAEK